jgi:hypothetical protein
LLLAIDHAITACHSGNEVHLVEGKGHCEKQEGKSTGESSDRDEPCAHGRHSTSENPKQAGKDDDDEDPDGVQKGRPNLDAIDVDILRKLGSIAVRIGRSGCYGCTETRTTGRETEDAERRGKGVADEFLALTESRRVRVGFEEFNSVIER